MRCCLYIPTSVKVALVLPLVFVLLTALLIVATRERVALFFLDERAASGVLARRARGHRAESIFLEWNLLGWQFGRASSSRARPMRAVS